MLSDKAIDEYREIYKEEFGRDISVEEARKQADNFLKLMQLILSVPHSKSDDCYLLTHKH
jgi:hypothetical protein